MEPLRPLHPMGYEASAEAYRQAAATVSARELSAHYTDGARRFSEELVPAVKRRLEALSGGAFCFDGWVGYGAGSDVDLMAHVVEAVAAREGVSLFPGDWYGFAAGCTQKAGLRFETGAAGRLACLCVPSVRSGHLTQGMVDFLASAEACLLNINLYPTLSAEERRETARALSPVMERSLVSVSFSRGFGLTASQLGVLLVPERHPYRARFEEQWRWFSYFYNAIAARAFLAVDLERLQAVDAERRQEVRRWLADRGLPVVESGSYYVKSFQVEGALPERLAPLGRDGLLRLCLKPQAV